MIAKVLRSLACSEGRDASVSGETGAKVVTLVCLSGEAGDRDTDVPARTSHGNGEVAGREAGSSGAGTLYPGERSDREGMRHPNP